MAYHPSEKTAVENPDIKLTQQLGIPVLKVNPLWAAGWPDRVFFVPGGKPLIIEFKRGEDSKLRAKQLEVIAKLKANGYDVHSCNTVEEGKAYLRARLEAHRVHEEGDAVDPGAPRVRPVPRPRAKKD